MADRYINDDIEFCINCESVEFEFKEKLEEKFLYQNILIVDSAYDLSENLDKLKKNVRCDFYEVKNIDSFVDFEKIACIVAVNEKNIDKIKKYAKKYCIPYIVVLTKICNFSTFKKYYYENENSVFDTNLPLGVCYISPKKTNLKRNIINGIIEISSLSFELLQSKLENLFFATQYDHKQNSEKKEIIINLERLIQNINDDCFVLNKQIVDLFLKAILVVSKDKMDMIDNLLWIYKNNEKFNNLVEIKYLFKQVLLSMEKNFFKYYQSKFKSEIDYKKHEQFLEKYNYKTNFAINKLPETKIEFILNEFRKKMVEFVDVSIHFDNTIKNIIAEIDVDDLFQMLNGYKKMGIANYLSVEPDLFCEKNFLSILYQLGLLNFEF